ncbi:hypothetical protein CBM2610_A10121 [Cupriavidus taiwanensis]|nr:hypothetical protein CBM2610_A10121 [Cupriavidus taiwanensis]
MRAEGAARSSGAELLPRVAAGNRERGYGQRKRQIIRCIAYQQENPSVSIHSKNEYSFSI